VNGFVKKINNFFWRIFKDDLVLMLFLPKPRPVSKDLIPLLEGYHFHYSFGLDIKSSFSAPRKQLNMVAKDIYQNSNKGLVIDYCEACPLDGYITWRLSKCKNISLNIIEYLSRNVEKINIISSIYGYKVTAYNGCLEGYNGHKFDVLSVLGCTYQMPNPLGAIEYSLDNVIKDKGVLYFDMIHPKCLESFEDERYKKLGVVDYGKYKGLSLVLRSYWTEEEIKFNLNAPRDKLKTIFYTYNDFMEFIVMKEVRIMLMETVDNGHYFWNTYKVIK